jgi:hypothetical protein
MGGPTSTAAAATRMICHDSPGSGLEAETENPMAKKARKKKARKKSAANHGKRPNS